MKDTILILSEQYPEIIKVNDRLIHQTIAIWLTKELHKGCMHRFIGADI